MLISPDYMKAIAQIIGAVQPHPGSRKTLTRDCMISLPRAVLQRRSRMIAQYVVATADDMLNLKTLIVIAPDRNWAYKNITRTLSRCDLSAAALGLFADGILVLGKAVGGFL